MTAAAINFQAFLQTLAITKMLFQAIKRDEGALFSRSYIPRLQVNGNCVIICLMTIKFYNNYKYSIGTDDIPYQCDRDNKCMTNTNRLLNPAVLLFFFLKPTVVLLNINYTDVSITNCYTNLT